MTNEEILNLYEALAEISSNKDFKFKAVLGFQLAKNKHALKTAYDAIIESRQKLIEKYGTKTDDGWLIPNEKIPSFEAELNALMSIETYVVIEQIPINQFEEEKFDLDIIEKLLPIIKK